MSNLLTISIFLLVVVAVWLVRLSKTGVNWAGPAAGVCAVVLIVLAVGRSSFLGEKGTRAAVMAQYEQYQAACGEVLGNSLAARHPEARVVLLSMPGLDDTGTQALLDPLQDALEDGGLSVTRQSVKPPEIEFYRGGDEDVTPEMKEELREMALQDPSMWWDVHVLNDMLLSLKSEADLVVSTFGLYDELDLASLLPRGRGPAFAMVSVHLPDPGPLLERTVLDTVVHYREELITWRPEIQVPKDAQTAFDQRYVLVAAGAH